ncbi:glycosyltransferase family 2 protein [Leptospira stimsonii]|uniref:Glycosyl transferase n=1 Tax=Leptospira stimsonii TaxID=2202203 RepID=A0A396ZAI9_9LEPT|nr:glycosyltransferase [Leptospira stimsonii]RHX90844.1 glycosyl transferase [Leptospira stimsonii]
MQKFNFFVSRVALFFQKLRYLFRQYQYFFFVYAKKKIDVDLFSYRPLISILVPVYNTQLKHLKAMFQSVEDQSYENWELILLDDASPDEKPGIYLKEEAKRNSKVRYYRSEKNGGISIATRQALNYASGEYVAFLDHDDRLSKDALCTIVDALQTEKNRPEFLYSDEIFQSKTFGVFSVSAKPDFSPEKLISHNYICHFVVVAKSLIDKMGGIREGYDGSQDHEFALRASRHTNRIRRLPFFLYIWRLHGESFSRKKAEVCERSSQKAISEYYAEKNEIVERIDSGHYPFTYHALRKLKTNHSVLIVVLGAELELDILYSKIIKLTQKTSNVNFEIAIGVNETEESQVSNWKFPENTKIHLHTSANRNLNTKEINRIVSDTEGDFIFFWNPILSLQKEDWLYELLQHGESEGIGAVSPVVTNSKRELLYSSLILGKKGFIGVSGNGLSPMKSKIWSGEWIEKNVSALSKNVLLISRIHWKTIQGLDEAFSDSYWDVDLSIRLRENGLRLVSNPFSEFLLESKRDCFREFHPGNSNTIVDRNVLFEKWGDRLETDSFYSPHLDLVGADRLPKGLFHGFFDWFWKRSWKSK